MHTAALIVNFLLALSPLALLPLWLGEDHDAPTYQFALHFLILPVTVALANGILARSGKLRRPRVAVIIVIPLSLGAGYFNWGYTTGRF